MYFDTSVILSLYLEDAFSPKAERFYTQHSQKATVSVWVDIEVKSALAVLVRTKRLTLDKAQRVLEAYDTNRAQGSYLSINLTPAHYEAGRRALSLSGSLRAGDALHLGAAQASELPLVTSDKTLFDAAKTANFPSIYLPDTATGAT